MMNRLELHRRAVELLGQEFVRHGFKVDAAEPETASQTFVVHKLTKHRVKVKSSRDFRYNYILKKHMKPHGSLIVGFVHFVTGEDPHLYLIRSTEWLTPSDLLRSRDYPGLASDPEYGLQLSRKNVPLLEQYSFDRIVSTLQ